MDKVRAYQRLPYPLKAAAAAERGRRLNRWRYGRDAARLVEQALDAETLPASAWRDLVEERTARMLVHAARRVPYYREQWLQRRRLGDRSPIEDLRAWPVLDKAAVRADPKAFVADQFELGRLYPEHTSGTTGTPLPLWWSIEATRCWYALFEARTRRWHGVSRHEPWAMLGGQAVVAAGRDRPPYWVWNRSMNQLYLSSYHLTAATAPHYAEAVERHGVTHLVGYPSALAALAGLLRQQQVGCRGPKVAFTNAESLLDHQRATIATGLGVEVVDMFGQAEMVTAGSECPEGTLHQWPEVGHVEVLGDRMDEPAADGGAGRLVATGLLNPAMPLIRYDTGDQVTPAAGEPCRCGRTLPPLGRVEGRRDDVITTPDGRMVGRLDPVFKADLPIIEAQIAQVAIDRLELRVVPAPGFGRGDRVTVTQRLRDRVGTMDVTLIEMDSLPRSSNGKFRAVVNELDAKKADDRAHGR